MLSRRRFLFVCALTALMPFGEAFATTEPDRRLSLYNIHTGETLDEEYRRGGEYDAHALRRIDYFLRCHYSNEVKKIDVNVLNLLCEIWERLGAGERVTVISGYRSPAYNEYLRRHRSGVARHSLHMKGQAIDFEVPGLGNRRLARLARTYRAGGVGSYPGFVHIDTGRVRYW